MTRHDVIDPRSAAALLLADRGRWPGRAARARARGEAHPRSCASASRRRGQPRDAQAAGRAREALARPRKVQWIEFPAGPQLLEALARRQPRLRPTGDSPPVFAQAAGKDLRLRRRRAAQAAQLGHPGASRLAAAHAGRSEGQEDRAAEGFERALPAGAGGREGRPAVGATSRRSTCRRPMRAPPSSAAASTPG